MIHTIILLADDWRSREEYLAQLALPLFYMGDFSLQGIVVDDFAAACRALRHRGYKVLDKCGAADIFFDGPGQLSLMLEALQKAAIHAELRDIAETLYQA